MASHLFGSRLLLLAGSRTLALSPSMGFGMRGFHSTTFRLLPQITVNVPSMGDSVTEGTLIEWYKGVGDAVAVDEDVASVETDKVTVAIKAPEAGVITKLSAEADETIYVGNELLTIDTEGAASAASQEQTPVPETSEASPSSEPSPEVADAEPVVINIPSLGDSVTEGTVVNWLKQPGEAIQMDEAYVIIETDKVSVDLKAPFAGQVLEHFAAVDDTVYVGEPVVKILPGAGAGTVSAPEVAAPAPPAPEPQAAAAEEATKVVAHSPARKFSIQFRHGRREVINKQIAEERGFDAAGQQPASSAPRVAVSTQDFGDAIDPATLPEFFGRLPALTEDEMERVLLGGADPY